ncbi:AAA family ATPase [Vibrio sp. AND4]|uniref:ParA family protein n=1 Tax=Vibrio sp. AND4 TaxID=314289 RepID=UPI00015EFF50|nr:AAA family ATPase [Vibrio sp. AND4]EDP59470.1 Chromosome partitioning ATPase [Vibrio sp. AND4]
MLAPVISFINMKGGVGKTTLCISVADYLANTLKKSVLVIDIDPQFNATQSFLNKYDRIEEYLSELKPNKKTIRSIFEVPTQVMERAKTASKDDVIINLADNLDMILGDLDIIFDTGSESIRVHKVQRFIQDHNLRNHYDYILIDSPPTISLFTDAALIASDYYLVPVKIDHYSVLGAASLISVVENLKFNYSHTIKPLGFVYTNTDNTLTDKTKGIKEEFESMQKSHNIKDDLYYFTSRLSHVRDLMVGVQGNIASSYSKSRTDIRSICYELIERINVLEEGKNGNQQI